MALRVITPPVGEQITLAMARLHLRLDDDGDSPAAHPDDPWLTGVGIPAAREYCEGWLGRSLAPQTFEFTLDQFPVATMELPMAPVTAVASVKYVDGDGAVQTMSVSDYDLDIYAAPPRLRPVVNATWPTPKFTTNAVRVRFTAGYDLPGDSPSLNPLPFAIKAAMLLMLGHLYERREATLETARGDLIEIPLGVQSLLRPYQLRLSMA